MTSTVFFPGPFKNCGCAAKPLVTAGTWPLPRGQPHPLPLEGSHSLVPPVAGTSLGCRLGGVASPVGQNVWGQVLSTLGSSTRHAGHAQEASQQCPHVQWSLGECWLRPPGGGEFRPPWTWDVYLVVHLLGAVEDVDHGAQGSAQVLGCLCLASPGGASGSSAHDQMEGLGQGYVASVRDLQSPCGRQPQGCTLSCTVGQ